MDRVYSVSQINSYVKNMFLQDFFLKKLTVKGEVSNCKYHSSGHIYFTLKDEKSSIACIMFAGNRAGLGFKMKDGDKVEVTGSVEIYERDGKYQLYAKTITQSGKGELHIRFEALKAELAEMGMFDACYKKKIPAYAKRIGIVTASTGAAIRDIENIAHRRNPYVQLFLYPAMVQGEGAAPSIVKGIEFFNEFPVDVIIVGRGGGSIEDLWAFNEEEVARAIFSSEIPVVSAVGHEIDYTISDFVSDLRAPTPSAAAELTVFDYNDFMAGLTQYENRLNDKMNSRLSHLKVLIAEARRKLGAKSPSQKLNEIKYTQIRFSEDLDKAIQNKILSQRNLIAVLTERLDGLSPAKRLKSGFAYVENDKGKKVNLVRDLNKNDKVSLYFSDGHATATIENTFIDKEDK
ncbi:MAG: exodeoxyribonuclease VII large subunit [Lachnospiraceae bacterium]|nr:exodeoxyribonuclease VII large subunit [Lachnospiraceae bacterium]